MSGAARLPALTIGMNGYRKAGPDSGLDICMSAEHINTKKNFISDKILRFCFVKNINTNKRRSYAQNAVKAGVAFLIHVPQFSIEMHWYYYSFNTM